MSLAVAPFEYFPVSFIVKFSTLLIISFVTSFIVKIFTSLIRFLLLFICELNVSTMTLFVYACFYIIT